MCTSLTLLPLPHLAWNWPLGQRLKNFIRCAGRQVEAPSSAGYLFNWGARHKSADFLCKRRSWPSCPRSARLRRTARELGGAVPASVLDGDSGVRKELPLRGRLEPRAAWYSRCIAVPQLLWHVLLRPSRSAALIPHPIDRRALCRFREELSSEVRQLLWRVVFA